MSRPEINTKNLCCLYFYHSGKRSIDLSELDRFQKHLYKGLARETCQNVMIKYSDYYLKEMCYQYNYIFEMQGEKLSVKKDVPEHELRSQLAWMPIGLLLSSNKVAKSYFDSSKKIVPNV